MTWLLSKKKDYLGKRSLARPDCRRDDRKQLVGLLSMDAKTVVAEGAQLVTHPRATKPVPMCGHVTSSYHSACLGHPIALALVENGRSRNGELLYAVDGRGVTTRSASDALSSTTSVASTEIPTPGYWRHWPYPRASARTGNAAASA